MALQNTCIRHNILLLLRHNFSRTIFWFKCGKNCDKIWHRCRNSVLENAKISSATRPRVEDCLLMWEDCVLQLLLLLLLRWWGKRCALPRDEMWLVQEALRRRGRFLRCDRHGVRGSPPLGSPTRRPPRPLQPRNPAPYRRSRPRSVLRKSIGRLSPRSTRAEGIDEKESRRERHFFLFAERMTNGRDDVNIVFEIGLLSVDSRWSIVDTSMIMSSVHGGKKMLLC